MKLLQLIKAAMMITLVGSTIVFGSPILKNTVDHTQKNLEATGLNEFQLREVVFWTYILAILGASVILLAWYYAALQNRNLMEFLKSIEPYRSNPTYVI